MEPAVHENDCQSSVVVSDDSEQKGESATTTAASETCRENLDAFHDGDDDGDDDNSSTGSGSEQQQQQQQQADGEGPTNNSAATPSFRPPKSEEEEEEETSNNIIESVPETIPRDDWDEEQSTDLTTTTRLIKEEQDIFHEAQTETEDFDNVDEEGSADAVQDSYNDNKEEQYAAVVESIRDFLVQQQQSSAEDDSSSSSSSDAPVINDNNNNHENEIMTPCTTVEMEEEVANQERIQVKGEEDMEEAETPPISEDIGSENNGDIREDQSSACSSLQDAALKISLPPELLRHVDPSSSWDITDESEESLHEQNIIRQSLVQTLREKFERGSGSEFNASNLSVDIERFYLELRGQTADYQRKRREALSRIHGADESYGHGLGEVDHSSPLLTAATASSTLKHISDENEDAGDNVVETTTTNLEQQRGKDSKEATVDAEADANTMLEYVKKVWGEETSGNVTALLNFLSTGEGAAPVFPPSEVVEALRYRQLDFVGRQRGDQPEEEWLDTLLQQLCFTYLQELEQQQIASRTIAEIESRNQVKLNDEGVEEDLSDLNSFLSDLECHIKALKTDKNQTPKEEGLPIGSAGTTPRMETLLRDPANQFHNEGGGSDESKEPEEEQDSGGGIQRIESFADVYRAIMGGELYPASRWEMLDNPDCRLKNKIVLSDMDEVEVVAVILKMHHDQQKKAAAAAFDDTNLCVLNNEKPSALKNKRVVQGKNLRVQFMLAQENAADNSRDGRGKQQPERSAICCWLC